MTHTISKQELFVALVTTVLTTVTRRPIIDTTGVIDTPLKLDTIKSLNMRNCKIMLKAKKI